MEAHFPARSAARIDASVASSSGNKLPERVVVEMLLWFQYKNRTGAESAGLEKVIEFIFVNKKKVT
ncbi:MAG: hypothetical protein WBW79_00430 [Desulfocapsaceae bacterium]